MRELRPGSLQYRVSNGTKKTKEKEWRYKL